MGKDALSEVEGTLSPVSPSIYPFPVLSTICKMNLWKDIWMILGLNFDLVSCVVLQITDEFCSVSFDHLFCLLTDIALCLLSI